MMKLKNETHPCALGIVFLALLLLFAPSCSKEDHSDHDHAEGSHEEEGAHADEEGGDGHDDHAEHDDEGHEEGVVELTERQIEAAGIRLKRAAAGDAVRYLSMPAVAAPDADAITHVNPRAPGIVRSIHKHLGETVQEGELLCVIDSIELGKAVAEYVRAKALVGAAETTLAREGDLFQQRLATAELMLQGAIEVNQRIFDRETELQKKGVSTIRPLLEAEKTLHNSKLLKDRDLTDLRAERDARLLALEVDLVERRINQNATHSALLALGVEPTLLINLQPDSPLLAGTYELRASRGGIVAGRHITTGEFVDAENKLYTLEDLSRVWIMGSAFEGQIQSVRVGQKGVIRLDAFPKRTFEGKVMLIEYEVDAESRALGVRIELENTTFDDWPEQYPIRPGMFGSIDLVIGSSAARVVLPESAIVHEDEGDFVFVLTAPGTFERRHVEVGPPTGKVIAILEGVEPGENVVVEGTFHLKSALGRSELGGGHSH